MSPNNTQAIIGCCLCGLLGVAVSLAAAWHFLKTPKCLYFRAREGHNCSKFDSDSVAFVIVEQHGRRRGARFPACIHEGQFRLANKQQRDTETLLGSIKLPDISGTDLIPPPWTARAALSCLWRGGGKNQRKEMSRKANVANMVINHRRPKELYSWQGQQRQVLANMVMGVLPDYSLNSSC